MSNTVLCPLGHRLTVAGRGPTACPRCGALVPVDEEPLDYSALPLGMAARSERRGSRDEEDEDDRPRRRRRRDEDDDEVDDDGPELEEAVPLTRKQRQMSMIRLGIIFHMIKLWIFLAATLFFVLIGFPLILFTMFALMAAFAGVNEAIEGVLFGATFTGIFFRVILNLAQTVAPIFGLVGSFFCFWTPARSEAKGTVIVSFLFDGMAIFLGLVQLIVFFFEVDARIVRMQNYLFLIRLSCTLTAWWLFQLYMRRFAFYIKESLLASECLNVIVHFLIATIISPTLLFMTFVLAFFFGSCIAIILFFVTFGWFVYFFVTFPIRQFRMLFTARAKIYNKFLRPITEDDILMRRY